LFFATIEIRIEDQFNQIEQRLKEYHRHIRKWA